MQLGTEYNLSTQIGPDVDSSKKHTRVLRTKTYLIPLKSYFMHIIKKKFICRKNTWLSLKACIKCPLVIRKPVLSYHRNRASWLKVRMRNFEKRLCDKNLRLCGNAFSYFSPMGYMIIYPRDCIGKKVITINFNNNTDQFSFLPPVIPMHTQKCAKKSMVMCNGVRFGDYT